MKNTEKRLILPLKKKWFDMWKSGEKPEDYRKITKYWAKRLCHNYDRFCTTVFDTPQIETPCFYREICPHFKPKKFDGLALKSGYPKEGDKDRNLMFDGSPKIDIGKGKEEWGAIPNEICFIIKKPR